MVSYKVNPKKVEKKRAWKLYKFDGNSASKSPSKLFILHLCDCTKKRMLNNGFGTLVVIMKIADTRMSLLLTFSSLCL